MCHRSFKTTYEVLHLAKEMIRDTRNRTCDFKNITFKECKLIIAVRGWDAEDSIIREAQSFTKIFAFA